MTPRRRLKYWLYNSTPGFAGRFPYFGTTVHFPPGAQVFRAICELGSFEPEIIDRLIKLARPHTTVFDIGANIGLMAIPVLRHCAASTIVSFEPSPSSLPFLQRTCAGAGFGGRWAVMGKALAGSPGERDFTVGTPEDALYEGFNSSDRIAAARTVRVAVSTVDDEWKMLGEPAVSVVKIDVEGAEAMVLAGSGQLLRRHRPAIVIEWNEPYLARFGTEPGELLSVADAYGYHIYTIPGGVRIVDATGLRVQMMACQNFMLIAPAP